PEHFLGLRDYISGRVIRLCFLLQLTAFAKTANCVSFAASISQNGISSQPNTELHNQSIFPGMPEVSAYGIFLSCLPSLYRLQFKGVLLIADQFMSWFVFNPGFFFVAYTYYLFRITIGESLAYIIKRF